MLFYLRGGSPPATPAGVRSLFAFWMGGACFDASGGAASGTLAVTEGADTAAFSGDVLIQGTLTVTEGADDALFTGTSGAVIVTRPAPDAGGAGFVWGRKAERRPKVRTMYRAPDLSAPSLDAELQKQFLIDDEDDVEIILLSH